MRTLILFKTALSAILHHKIRSLLTILGIITGIAAIIGTLAIGYGAEAKMRQEILSYGENYLFIYPGNGAQDGVQKTKIRPAKNLFLRDTQALKKQCEYIKKISPYLYDRAGMTYRGTTLVGDVKGGNSDLLHILGRKIARGTNYSTLQNERADRVVVIGHQVAVDLFKQSNPIGQTLIIRNIQFTIIGVVNELKHYSGFNNPNFNAYMPIATLRKYIKKTNNQIIHGIAITATDLQQLPLLVSQVTRIMRIRHNLEPGAANDFNLFDQYAMLHAAKTSSNTFNLFLFIIASISLLVGGIGVMNIMLVSITERQQEIGIRMALGAQQETILLQFLYEALMLCLIGGFLGIVLGICIPFIAHYYTSFPVVIKLQAIGISMLSILVIGLIFGYYPAYKASQLNPVKALIK